MSIAKVDENGHEYVLFRIDVYFFEYLLAVEIDEKGYTDKELIFEEKRKALEKILGCKFIRINTSKRYHEDYETGRIQTFISKFKSRQLRKIEKESNKRLKELEDKINIKTSIKKSNHPIKTECLK